MFTPKELIEKGICISFAEAQRILVSMSDDKIQKKIKEKEKNLWGRKFKKVSNIVWPEEVIW